MNINIFKTKEELSDKLSGYIINHHLNGSIALSGGSTPLLLFKDLSRKLNDTKAPNTKFFWVDERCVSPDSDESNFKMANEYLFTDKVFRSENIFRIKGENDPIEEVKTYNNILKENLPESDGLPQFDLIILGLGDDGHTASLFPNKFKTFSNEPGCVVASHPSTGQKRISLSERIINNSLEVIFHVTGSNKKNIVDDIINEKGNYKLYPGSYIRPKSKNISWYLDFDASEKLIN